MLIEDFGLIQKKKLKRCSSFDMQRLLKMEV